MVFNSYKFFVFFPIVMVVYFIIPRKTRYIWLLITSYYFYMCWNPKYAVLIAVSTVVTWLGGLLIDRRGKAQAGILHKKQVIILCFLFNIGILIFFKYSGFLIANLNFLLEKIQICPVRSLDVVLPVGISFYTFQALSYIVDVYRGKVETERNFLKYALNSDGAFDRSGRFYRSA